MANQWYWKGCAERDVDIEQAQREWEGLEPSTRIRRFNAALSSGDQTAIEVFDSEVQRQNRAREEDERQMVIEGCE
jgi:hypothetical protein